MDELIQLRHHIQELNRLRLLMIYRCQQKGKAALYAKFESALDDITTAFEAVEKAFSEEVP